MKFVKDKGELKKLAKQIIQEEPDYELLTNLKILWHWRDGKPKKDEGMYIAAQVQKLGNKQRDIFGYDVAVEVNYPIWKELSTRWQKRLIWHELRHISVDVDEEQEDGLARDKDGRISLHLVPHDIVVRTFKAEVKKYGLEKGELKMVKFIASAWKRIKQGKLKKYRAPDVLKAPEEEEEYADDEQRTA